MNWKRQKLIDEIKCLERHLKYYHKVQWYPSNARDLSNALTAKHQKLHDFEANLPSYHRKGY